MGLFENAIVGLGMMFSSPRPEETRSNLAAQTKDLPKTTLPWKTQSVTQTQNDIRNWKSARAQYYNAEDPKNFAIQLLFNDVADDNLFSAQIENRNNMLYSVEWDLKSKAGVVDEDQTKKLKKSPAFRKITDAILMSRFYGYSLIELALKLMPNGDFDVTVIDIPRTNVVPQLGRFYFDYSEDKFIEYRKIQEYGINVLEFNSETIGLINKAVPHVLMKRFAQSNWSELAEIYGIPPRFMKTNTSDTNMLDRAEQMMADMGSASWFIIDNHEEFEFAQASVTKGEVYEGLIKQCNNELSLLISGAVVGQDTKNGSNAKEVASQELLATLSKSDLERAEQMWNNIVIPALVKLGWLSGDIQLEFDPSEDLSEIWTRTKELLPYAEFDEKGVEWIRTKFGVEISAVKPKAQGNTQLGILPDFFG